MTCIVALAHEGAVFMGADSAAVHDSGALDLGRDPKVFVNGPCLIGFTTSFRMGQLLQYALIVPEPDRGEHLHSWMATDFVDAVRDCLKAGGYSRKSEEVESAGAFLVGVRGRIFRVEDDYNVRESIHPFDAVGCAEQVARGALFASQDILNPAARVRLALEASEAFHGGVRGPFHLLEYGASA